MLSMLDRSFVSEDIVAPTQKHFQKINTTILNESSLESLSLTKFFDESPVP